MSIRTNHQNSILNWPNKLVFFLFGQFCVHACAPTSSEADGADQQHQPTSYLQEKKKCFVVTLKKKETIFFFLPTPDEMK